MVFSVDGLQAVLVHVGIDLRGADVAVAEEFLDDAEIGPAADQVGREAVAEGVGGNPLQQAAGPAVFSTIIQRPTRSSGLPVRDRNSKSDGVFSSVGRHSSR